MSTIITMDKTLVSSVPRSMNDLLIDLVRPDFLLPDQVAEIDALEMLLQTPSADRGVSAALDPGTIELSSVDMRELLASLATFAVDASCQFIALAAAMPFVPKMIGKPIYRPLVRRIFS